jgi:serine protease Do
MLSRILLCLAAWPLIAAAQPPESSYAPGENWTWNYGGEEVGGGSSYLGVDIADVTPERLTALKLKEEHGAEVTMVDQDAPAGKAGLKEHDVIQTLNGTAVESAAQLRRMIRETPGGRVVTLGISRDGQPLSLKVQLANRGKVVAMGSKPFKFEMPVMPNIPDFDLPVSVVIAHSSARSGLMIENITPQLGEFFGAKNGNGALVRSVEKGSRADKAGFRAGDLIVKVNAQPVRDTSDFTHALRSASNNTASVTVIREKKEQTLTLTLPEKKDTGILIEEESLENLPELSAETARQVSRLDGEMARLRPALDKLRSGSPCREHLQKRLQESERKLQQQSEKLRREMKGDWTQI